MEVESAHHVCVHAAMSVSETAPYLPYENQVQKPGSGCRVMDLSPEIAKSEIEERSKLPA